MSTPWQRFTQAAHLETPDQVPVHDVDSPGSRLRRDRHPGLLSLPGQMAGDQPLLLSASPMPRGFPLLGGVWHGG